MKRETNMSGLVGGAYISPRVKIVNFKMRGALCQTSPMGTGRGDDIDEGTGNGYDYFGEN